MSENMKYDVVVIGGGTAGVFATISSARSGAKTLLIERQEHLGGQMSVGMGIAGAHDVTGGTAVEGLLTELAKRVESLESGPGFVTGPETDRWIPSTLLASPEKLKNILHQMVTESGADVMLLTELLDVKTENQVITSLLVVYAGRKYTITPHVVIDTSGNAVAGYCAGAEIIEGDNKGSFQSVSMVFSIAAIDIKRFEHYMNTVINDQGRPYWSIQNSSCRGCINEYWLPWKNYSQKHALPNTLGIYYHNNTGEIYMNSTHVQIDPLDVFAVSDGILKLRQQAMLIVDFMRANVKGCENAYVSRICELGIRESRRIKGEYLLTREDLESVQPYTDVVCRGAYPPDMHTGMGDVDISINRLYNYGIPFKALYSNNIKNLMMGGRCISATHEAAAGVRGMAVCIATGQAVGVASAICIADGCYPREIDIFKLQIELRKAGVVL